MSNFQAELRRPFRDTLERDVDASLRQQIFDVAKVERKSVVGPDRMGNDLSGKAMAFDVGERALSHASPVSTQFKQAVKATPPFACSEVQR